MVRVGELLGVLNFERPQKADFGPAEMEFCLVPIFLKGAPWGYLGADNLYSRRPIESGANQEVLEVYGQLLDLAINVEEFRQGKRGAASKLIAPRKRRPKV